MQTIKLSTVRAILRFRVQAPGKRWYALPFDHVQTD